MESYIDRHISFGVDEFEGLWKLQFLHPFFFTGTKRVVTVYLVPPNSDFKGSTYNGYEVVHGGPHIMELIGQLLPMIQHYPYRWELEGKKLDVFGYDLVSGMTKTSEAVGSIDFTDIAFAEINRYYNFVEAMTLPKVVVEGEKVQRDAAMVKLDVVLEKAQWTNQISFNYYTSHPIEIVSIVYQESTMKYSAAYEIALDTITIENVSSVSILFPSVFAKKFTVVFAQPTYTIENISAESNLYDESKAEEKYKISVNLDALSITAANQLDETYDNIWGEESVAQARKKIESSMLTQSSASASEPEWRPEYQAARNESDKQMVVYEQKIREYQEAESKYKQDMQEYVRYQQQLADWYRKWG